MGRDFLEKYKILMELNRKAIFAEKISDIEREEAISILFSRTQRAKRKQARAWLVASRE